MNPFPAKLFRKRQLAPEKRKRAITRQKSARPFFQSMRTCFDRNRAGGVRYLPTMSTDGVRNRCRRTGCETSLCVRTQRVQNICVCIRTPSRSGASPLFPARGARYKLALARSLRMQALLKRGKPERKRLEAAYERICQSMKKRRWIWRCI